MQYILTDTKTATGYSLQIISGVKYRLFQFMRIPDIGVGDWMVDPTDPVGYKQVAYVGSAGTGYAHEYVSPSSVTVDTIVNFYRAIPDVTAAANEQDVARRLDRLARFVGGRISPANGEPLNMPVFRKSVFRVFAQNDRLTICLEKLDEALGLLILDYNDRIADHEGRISLLEPDVDSLINPVGYTVTRTTYLSHPERVYQSTAGEIINPWLAIDLAGTIPTKAKAIIGFAQFSSTGNQTRFVVALSPNDSANEIGKYKNNSAAIPVLEFIIAEPERGSADPNNLDANPGATVSHFTCRVNGVFTDDEWRGNRKVYLKVLQSTRQDDNPVFRALNPIYGDLTNTLGVLSIWVAGYQW